METILDVGAVALVMLAAIELALGDATLGPALAGVMLVGGFGLFVFARIWPE